MTPEYTEQDIADLRASGHWPAETLEVIPESAEGGEDGSGFVTDDVV